ncbi:MAG: hypothetical protein ACHQ4H_14005 [Ktedonobacterales bacterium]
MNPTWLLRLYPAAWRARYGDELGVLLAGMPATPLALLDVLLGALDAHLHVDLLPGRVLSMTSRLRSSAVILIFAFAVFLLAYASWGRLTDPRAPFTAAAQAHRDVLLAWDVAQGAAALAGIAVLVWGVPLVLAALLAAWRGGRRDLLALFALPGAGAILCGIVLVAANAVAPPIPPGQQVRPVTGLFAILGLLFFALAFLTFASGTVSVALAVSRSTLGERVLRFARWPAAAAAGAMAASLIAMIVWAALLWQNDPLIYDGVLGNCANTQCYGPAADIGAGTVAGIAGLMALAVIIAGVGLARAFAARSADPAVPA